MARLTSDDHLEWDEFLVELRDLCKKHDVLFESNEDAEIIITKIHNAYVSANLGCYVGAKTLDEILKN